MRKTLLAFFLCVLACVSFAQTTTLQQKLYYTCKVWGFVKYYHSEVSVCHVNWDSVLLHTLPLVESSATDAQFNDALDTMLAAAGPMALATSFFPDTIATELKRNRDWNWIASPVLRSDVQIQLDTIKNNFRPHAGCWTINNPHTTSYPGWLSFPYDSLGFNTFVTYPGADSRLLMLFSYWNIIRYFNPYNYVLDTSWDTTLSDYAVPVMNAPSDTALYLLFLKVATRLNDAHVSGYTGSSGIISLPGFYLPHIRLKYVGGQYVVIKSSEAGVNTGDIILSADGLTTHQWEDSLRPYFSAGNDAAFRDGVSMKLMRRWVSGTSETLVVEDSAGATHTVVLTCTSPNADRHFFYDYIYPADSLNAIKWTILNCNTGYINMAQLQPADIFDMYSVLRHKSAIIIDLRNYPNGTAWPLADLMFSSKTGFSKVMVPDVTYPGTYSWGYDSIGVNGNTVKYDGHVILLVDEVTISQAEYSCMMLGSMPNAIKVGSQTQGADGDVSHWNASTDYTFGFTTLGIYYSNGDSTQRIGIIPDSVVYPTKEGIRARNDEVLNKALSIACSLTGIGNITANAGSLKVFPNPANNTINIQADHFPDATATISIKDIAGRVLLQKQFNSMAGRVAASCDIGALAPGMYFVCLDSELHHSVAKLSKQ